MSGCGLRRGRQPGRFFRTIAAMCWPIDDPWRLGEGETRSISAENPTGARGGGARAAPGDDEHCTPAARHLGRGWKVRPCLRNIPAGSAVAIADVEGPGIVRHLWITAQPQRLATLRLRVSYDGAAEAAVDAPLGAFFANGIDGRALVRSIPVAVNPHGGLNSYWPMPFRRRLLVEVVNDGDELLPELFYQLTWTRRDVPPEAACLHARWSRGRTSRQRPEHVILDDVAGDGQYVGTYLIWRQHHPGWWGEGEVKLFIDGDGRDAPTICGTGTEDYFGGAWGFCAPPDPAPIIYTGPWLGYPQMIPRPGGAAAGDPLAVHGLYRWHLPDPVRFRSNLRVTVQALGWRDDGTYQLLEDDIASVAYWYQRSAGA